MNKRSFKNIILMLLFLVYIVGYKLYIFPNYMEYSEIITTSFLMILLSGAVLFLGFRKLKTTYVSQNVMHLVIFYLIIMFTLMYGLGFVTGFLKNAYSNDALMLVTNILCPALIIILVELFRYVVVWANKDKKIVLVLYTLLLILFEITIGVRSIPFNDLEALFRLSATVIIPVIVKNFVMTYLCYHVGYKVPLVYRLVMDMYLIVVPVIPDYGEYIQSLLLISLPILIYINAFTIIDEKNNKVTHIFTKSNFTVYEIPIIVLVVILACLISGFFPHYMIGVGSDSMSPKINKGDAVILKKYNNEKDNLKKGDIIAFQSNGKVIIHRVVEVDNKKGKNVYYTKGDFNNTRDSSPVSQKQIRGIVKFRIPFIAYPTVWLNEYIHG